MSWPDVKLKLQTIKLENIGGQSNPLARNSRGPTLFLVPSHLQALAYFDYCDELTFRYSKYYILSFFSILLFTLTKAMWHSTSFQLYAGVGMWLLPIESFPDLAVALLMVTMETVGRTNQPSVTTASPLYLTIRSCSLISHNSKLLNFLKRDMC